MKKRFIYRKSKNASSRLLIQLFNKGGRMSYVLVYLVRNHIFYRT